MRSRVLDEEDVMREILGWLVEQACRPLDTQVCAIGNIDDDDLGGYYLSS